MARRLATAVAYGGSGVGILGLSTLGVLALEGLLARRTVGPPRSEPPEAGGVYAAPDVPADTRALSLLVLGDSAAAGLGATVPAETPGAQLAVGLSALARRPVRLHNAAAVGARSEHLDGQLDVAFEELPRPDIAMIIIGVNDVTHLRSPNQAVPYLRAAVERLRGLGTAVVVGTCPDLGTIRPFPQPLRAVAAAMGRRLAEAQTVATVEVGARTVSLGDLLGPQFAERPSEMFGPDRFHPSSIGYAAAAAALLPSAAAALDLDDGRDLPVGVLPLRDAAFEAARNPGAEVMRGEVAGKDRGPRGRFAALRHRRLLRR
ncbi:MAG: SGNH/GDSL hydrolase family protein [Streptosporangiales bacterium]|nr:SGNH/GDSL hydrolase family protein [Streptosporangiales bacterium]